MGVQYLSFDSLHFFQDGKLLIVIINDFDPNGHRFDVMVLCPDVGLE